MSATLEVWNIYVCNCKLWLGRGKRKRHVQTLSGRDEEFSIFSVSAEQRACALFANVGKQIFFPPSLEFFSLFFKIQVLGGRQNPEFEMGAVAA